MSSEILKIGAALGLISLLAACGGGGGGSGDGTPPVTRVPPVTPTPPTNGGTAAQMTAAQQALLTSYTAPTIYTPLAALPRQGQAVYDGYFYGTLANTGDGVSDTLLGEMDMTVTFTTTSANVTGRVSNFVDDNGAALTGTLSLGNGSLDRGGSPSNDATLLAGAQGSLRDAGGQTLIIGTQLEGDFLASGHAAVGGEVLGSVTVNGVDQDFDGGFIGAR